MSVATLADAKAYLDKSSSVDDAELQSFIDAAESAIAAKIGPLTVVTGVTSRVRGWSCVLLLPQFPVAALTSVTPVGGTALDVTQLIASPDSLRVVEWLQFGWFGARWYDVVYSVGRAVSPMQFGDIYKADLELIRHMWETQRGRAGAPSSPSRFPQGQVGSQPGQGYTFPPRVNELLQPYVPLGVG